MSLARDLRLVRQGTNDDNTRRAVTYNLSWPETLWLLGVPQPNACGTTRSAPRAGGEPSVRSWERDLRPFRLPGLGFNCVPPKVIVLCINRSKVSPEFDIDFDKFVEPQQSKTDPTSITYIDPKIYLVVHVDFRSIFDRCSEPLTPYIELAFERDAIFHYFTTSTNTKQLVPTTCTNHSKIDQKPINNRTNKYVRQII